MKVKKMKIIIFSLVFLSILIVGYETFWPVRSTLSAKKVNLSDAQQVLRVFEETGADFEELNFIGWAQINEGIESKNQLLTAAKGLVETFQLSGVPKYKYTEDTQKRQVTVSYQSSGKPTDLTLLLLIQNRVNTNPNSPQTYLSLRVTSKEYGTFKTLEGKVNLIFKKLHANNKRIATVISGSYHGVLSAKGMRNVSSKSLSMLNAKVKEGIGEKNFLSVSAYTPQISENIRIKDYSVNFNVALRANQLQKKTYIYLGSPIIALEY